MDSNVDSRVTLQDLTSFLSKQSDDKDRLSSLEDRTSYAIKLLQSLPCARFAVLEKLGEVFFDETQQYIIELERQQVAGLPAVLDETESSRNGQIKKIQQVLVSSIESNSKAWAPVIFQWSVQTLSQISGKYGSKRYFVSMNLEERIQTWLSCSATNNLMEIMVSCLKKILEKNQDNCVKILLNATLTFTPFFDWALAHVCTSFPSIVPYKFLCHALDAFSKQSRKAELIKDTLLTIFRLIMPQKKELIKEGVFKLFMTGFTNVSEKSKSEQQMTLRVIPFLLHMTASEVHSYVDVIDKVLDILTIDHLRILNEQSKQRDDVMQRSIVRRTVNCLKIVDCFSYKILQYLIKYTCMEDKQLCQEDPDLAKAVQNVCFVILECLQIQLKHEVHEFVHQNKESGNFKGDETGPVPFLTSLSMYTKQCCRQMLESSGTKKDIIQDITLLMAVQEGRSKMIEILNFILLNSSIEKNKSTLETFVTEFELQEPNVFRDSLESIFRSISNTDKFTSSQINNLVLNLQKIIEHEENNDEGENSLIKISEHLKWDVNTIAQLAVVPHIDGAQVLSLLKRLSTKELRMSEYSNVVQSILHCYFKSINKLSKMEDVNDLSEIIQHLKLCEELLIGITNQYKAIQQYVLRLLVQGILQKENEEFTSDPEEPIVRVELLEKNYTMTKENRFHSNVTSILFKDGLRIKKRKLETVNRHNTELVKQYYMGTLYSLLSLNGGYGSSSDGYDKKEQNFYTFWGETQFSRPFPSAYGYMANLLVELVSPETVPVVTWPDEDFIKYTIERDLKVKNCFEEQPILWDILELVSTARPSLYHCLVLIQSLYGMSLKFWQANRRPAVTSSPEELRKTCRLLYILKQAGWLPSEFSSISDAFPFIRPKEVYEILSAIWKYLKVSNLAPDRFIDRDSLGRPQLTTTPEHIQIVRSVIKIVFFRNISKTGHLYRRFLSEHPS